MMAVKSSLHICYLYKTSDQEQIDVHTSHGLHAIEVRRERERERERGGYEVFGFTTKALEGQGDLQKSEYKFS